MALKKLLICGGCGFIGSNFIRYLHNKYPDYRITNLDLLTYAGNPENLSDIETSSRYQFVRGDIGDRALIENLINENKFDVVVNFAAESHVDRSIVDASPFIKTNIQGAHSLMESVRKCGVPCFVYISTDEVYGDVPHGIKSSETHPLSPTNPYSASKAAADLLTQAYMKTYKLPAMILRSSNNFGPYQYPEKLVPLILTNLIEGKKIPVHGSGQHIRCWIHVQDFCNALDLIIHKGEIFGVYNISGEEKTNLEIIKSLANAVGVDGDKHIEFVSDRLSADFRYAPDSTRISRELGWQRSCSFDDSLKDLVGWYSSNRDWWQKIKQKREFSEHYQKQSKGQYT